MLIDHIEVTFKGGNGGNGRVSFRKTGRGPDGGNGGKGGDLYLLGQSDLTLLNQFSRLSMISAEDGKDGGKNNMTGKAGEDMTIILPIGTSLIDKTTGKEILEIKNVGEKILLAKGGKGGLGNWEFRSPTLTTPKFARKGESGETFNLVLSLRYIADFGLIGLPNAGKSSLLNELTNAKVKTAEYAFTTLSPNLGVFANKVIADIPGLIKGASEGKGLGIGFLKHIEKVSLLLHCVSCDSADPVGDYEVVKKEMEKYNTNLSKKREIILLTKSDLVNKEKAEKLIKMFKEKSKDVIAVSIYDPESLKKLQLSLKKFSKKT